MKILSTKTLEESSLTYAHSLNVEVECVDFIESKKTAFIIPENEFDSVIFTSSNAVNFFMEQKEFIKQKQVFSTAGKTAELLVQNNIQPTFIADSASELADKIIQSSSVKSLLHIGGNRTLGVIENKLRLANILYQKLIVYNTILVPKKIAGATFNAILFFSPSGIESFFTQNKLSDNILCCAIGETTADVLKTATANKVIVAKKSTAEAMFDAILSV